MAQVAVKELRQEIEILAPLAIVEVDALAVVELQDRVFALYTGERWVAPDDGAPPWVTREK